MPPVNSQGSRGGLVAAVVAFTVLFVAATIFAIYYGVQYSKDEESLTELKTRYRDVVQDLGSQDITNLKAQARSDTKLVEQTALAEAVSQRNALRQKMIGLQAPAAAPSPDQSPDQAQASDISDTMTAAQKALDTANAMQGPGNAKFTADNLVAAMNNMTTVISELKRQVADANAKRDQAIAQAGKDSQAARDAQGKADSVVTATQTAMQQQVDAANDAIKKSRDDATSVRHTFDDEQRSASAALEAADKRRVDISNALDTANKRNNVLTARLSGRRIDVEDPVVRRPEGQIISISGSDVAYINLGQGDQIVPGMTFEVYDKNLPLPKLGDGTSDQDLPVGKASIEVTKVLANSSQCHVSGLAPNQQLVEGDRILNLIYDRNVKFNFYVYGNFDVRTSGHATAADADVIKRLVTQWGGSVDDKLDVQTDFVVIGDPPEVPSYTTDELKDPLNEQNLANAKRDLDLYAKIVVLAADLHIPIMNQTRFLFFTGFSDLAQR